MDARATGDACAPKLVRSEEADRDAVRERLRAYILPNAPSSEAELAAFERAVDAQLAFEREGEAPPPGVASLRIGDYSLTLAEPAGAALTRSALAPAAWAILTNAGLLRRRWPVARRL